MKNYMPGILKVQSGQNNNNNAGNTPSSNQGGNVNIFQRAAVNTLEK